jgi:sRNA-binding regulator protein Hfq
MLLMLRIFNIYQLLIYEHAISRISLKVLLWKHEFVFFYPKLRF